jgi:2-methylcitrate dehydratase PrpD
VLALLCDPASFDDSALSDAAIRGKLGRVAVVVADPPTKVVGASIVTIELRDGRSFTREVAEFNGTPARALDRDELRDKFVTLTRARYGAAAAPLFERLLNLENEAELSWVRV